MRINMIPIKEIKKCHPKGLDCATDREYALIGGEILQQLIDCKIMDIYMDGLKTIALNFTMYFEDIVADVGIWRAFTSKMKEMYGRYLPFYDVDEENYYRDEPNLEDLQVLLWYTMLEVHEGKIANPENPIIKIMSQKALDVMEKHFETVSVNEELKDFFEEATFMEDYYQQREVLKWINFNCYLTYDPFKAYKLMDTTETFIELGHTKEQAYYLSECLMPYNNETGPLNILAQEWLAAILNENGNNEAAKIVGEQHFKGYSTYKIDSAVQGQAMTFSGADGETFTVTAYNLNNPPLSTYDTKYTIAAFVYFNKEWNLLGNCIFSDNGESYKEHFEDSESRSEMQKKYANLIEKNGGSPLFYFADAQSFKEFVKKNFCSEIDKIKIEIKNDEKDLIMCIPTDGDNPAVYSGGARCVKAADNPFYDREYAEEKALNMVMSLPRNIQTYLIKNNLVPDAAINSIYGQERGNYLVQHNFDFIVRAVNSRI